MMNKYEIEKDPYLNKFVVWEVHNNYKVEVYRNRLKRLCAEWIKENEGQYGLLGYYGYNSNIIYSLSNTK